MTLLISLSILLVLAIIQGTVPYFIKRTIAFGVTIPEQYIQDASIRTCKKQYTVFSLIVSLSMIMIFCLWTVMKKPTEEFIMIVSTTIEFGIIFISLALYIYFHEKMKHYKEKMQWEKQLKQVAVVDLTVRSEENLPPWYIYLFPMLITIGLLGYTILQYDVLPNQIPTHWGPSGEPDAFTEKTPFTAIQLPIFSLVFQLMFMGIQVGMKFSGIKLSATNVKASKNRQLKLRKLSSWFLFFMVLLMTMLFTFFQLTTIHPELFSDSILKFIIPFGVLFLILAGTIVLTIKVGRSDKLSTVVSEEIMDVNDDQFWKGGLIYFNKNDPSIFVEKRFGVGWTLNFANPIGYLLIFVPIIFILLFTLLFN